MALARATALTLTAGGLAAVLASCTSTANISDLYTATDATGDHKRTTFYTDSVEVHCIAEAGIGRPDATIEIYVRQLQGYDYLNNNFFPTNRVYAYTQAQPTPGDGIQKVDVSIIPLPPSGNLADATGDVPFEVGHFQCEAYLDGVLERTTVFNIDFPPTCPESYITRNSLCFGYYKLNQVCKLYGDSSDPGQGNCTCTVDKGWSCDS